MKSATPSRKNQPSEILAGLVAVFHRNDPSRPVTQGLFRPNVSHDYDNGLADLLDVVAFVTATVADINGIPIPDASGRVSFSITGPGIIAAVDNGDNSSAESFHASERHAYQGRCLAMVRAVAARGKITLTASTPGLKDASITLKGGSDRDP